MSKESIFTPLPQAQTRDLRTYVQLPFGLENRIGINIPVVKTLCQLGGVEHLQLISFSDGNTSNSEMNIVGMGSDGAAVTGFGKVKVAEKSIQENTPGNMHAISQVMQWSSLKIAINTNEQKHRFLEANKDARDPVIWAKELNISIKKGIIFAGFENLLTKNTLLDLVNLANYPYDFLRNLNDPEKIIPRILSSTIFVNLLLGLFGIITKQKTRLSLFIGGFQPDRFLALTALATTNTLVKPLDQKNQKTDKLSR